MVDLVLEKPKEARANLNPAKLADYAKLYPITVQRRIGFLSDITGLDSGKLYENIKKCLGLPSSQKPRPSLTPNGGSTLKIDLLSRAQLSIANKNNFRYPLAVAEKDYILAVVLKIIYSSKLKDTLIFKGGTAIHHLYLTSSGFQKI